MEFEEERGGVNGGEAAGKDGHLRIYIGGLGGGITADDLKRTFSTPQLGSVESVEIIRTKGRSIAYLDFRPCSEKGLAKLFSTYNGCLWKGGKLRLEKAKEHYMIRMKREWEADAQLSSASDECVDSVESVAPSEKLVKDRVLGTTPLRIFFPKLRKVKPVPFKGSGKHKYSFQRVAVPPLPVHFCDCDEHSVPSDTKKSYKHENEVYEMKEEEIDMMNSVMSKLFNQKKVPQPASSEAKVAMEAPISTNSNDEFQVDDKADEISGDDDDDDDLIINVLGRSDDNLISNNQELQHSQSRPLQRKKEIQGKKPFQQANISEPAYSMVEYATKEPSPAASEDDSEVEMSDDDDFVFNVVSGSNNKIPSVDSWVQETIAGDKELQASQSERGKGKRKIQEKNTVQSNKKRKAAPDVDKNDKLHASKNQAADPNSGVQPSSTDNLHAKGFSWRDLVNGRDEGYFSINSVVPSEPPMVEKLSKSETQDVLDKGNQRNETSKAEVVKTTSEVLPQMSKAETSMAGEKQSKSETQDVFDKGNQINETSEAKVVKTTSEVLPQMSKAETSVAGESTPPAQTFSWKRLLGGLDDGAFSINQIVPGSENQEEQEQHANTFAEPNPDQSGLNLSSSVPVVDIAKPGGFSLSSELHGKQRMPAKQTTGRDGVGAEGFKFQRSKASLREWKLAKAALSRSCDKKTTKE